MLNNMVTCCFQTDESQEKTILGYIFLKEYNYLQILRVSEANEVSITNHT